MSSHTLLEQDGGGGVTIYSGWLEKQTAWTKKWTNRWIMLKGNWISYSLNKGGEEKGRFEIEDVREEPDKDQFKIMTTTH
eukprot:gene3892-2241_t